MSEAGRSLENGRDDGRPLGHAGHRIDAVERLRLLAGEFLGDITADQRYLAGAADEQDAVDVLGPEFLEVQGLFDGGAGLNYQRHDDALELGPVDLLFQVQVTFRHQFGLAGHGRRLGGQLDLGPFDREQEAAAGRAN